MDNAVLIERDAMTKQVQLDQLRTALDALQKEKEHADTEFARLRDAYKRTVQELAERKERGSDEVIPFPKDDESNFDSGRFELSPAFLEILKEKGIVACVEDLADEYGDERVIVEVFGYTDGKLLARSCWHTGAAPSPQARGSRQRGGVAEGRGEKVALELLAVLPGDRL